jgi:hypothetical protein
MSSSAPMRDPRAEERNPRDWKAIAEEVSKEPDSEKLTQLTDELLRALEKDETRSL